MKTDSTSKGYVLHRLPFGALGRLFWQWWFAIAMGLWVLVPAFSPSLAADGTRTKPSRGQVLKVLPHLLDAEGRAAQAPSLFERDAYQAHLRKHPELVSTTRFDVQTRRPVPAGKDLRLRLTLRTTNRADSNPLQLETPVKKGLRGRAWHSLTLPTAEYQAAGKIVAWRVELMDGDFVLSTQTSFLW